MSINGFRATARNRDAVARRELWLSDIVFRNLDKAAKADGLHRCRSLYYGFSHANVVLTYKSQRSCFLQIGLAKLILNWYKHDE
jgi:hypothetical protein